jgi:hypothetical protein
MNDVIVKDEIVIENLIYEIRGVQVILDSDLARLYECVNGTKDINKAVKRNIERFPENFMFQLTDVEYGNLRFQIGTSKVRGGRIDYELNREEAQGIIKVINNYSNALNILDDYDYEKLNKPNCTI